MALLMQERKKSVNWFGVAIALFVAAGIGIGTYYLFFAATPGIDIVVPPPLQAANQISYIMIDPTTVINSKQFRALRSYTGVAGVGALGRSNPFLPL